MTSKLRNLCRDIVFHLHNKTSTSKQSTQYLSTRSSEDVLTYVYNNRICAPVLTSKDVTDYGKANFVADPFFYPQDQILHLFFEVYNRDKEPTASIGHAMSKDNGQTWQYNQIILEIDRHISYPYVFDYNSDIYLLPDLSNSKNRVSPVRLFRFDNFPNSCEPVEDIIDPDHKCLDTVVFQYDDYWWLILGSGNNDEIRVYFSDELIESNWRSHPQNPVVTGRKFAGRPGGRPLLMGDRLVMFYQDCTSIYGNALRAYEIEELSTELFKDKPLFDDPILSGKKRFGWNSGRMHHLDLQVIEDKLFVATDGDIGLGRSISTPMWSIGFSSVSLRET